MANNFSAVWPLADFSPQRKRPVKDAWKLPRVLDPFFHKSKERNRYIKCLEIWVRFCQNALKLISEKKSYKPFPSLIYNNKYNFELKNILGKSEWRDYGIDAWWFDWREFWFQRTLGVSGRAAWAGARASAVGMRGAAGAGPTPRLARQGCAAWRTTGTPPQTNARSRRQAGVRTREQKTTAAPWGTRGNRSKRSWKRTERKGFVRDSWKSSCLNISTPRLTWGTW